MSGAIAPRDSAEPASVIDGDAGDAGKRRRRVLITVIAYLITVLALVSLNFILPRLLPGDPITALSDPSSPTSGADAATRAQLARYYGLSNSLPAQFVSYVGALGHGDLGVSIRYGTPVTTLLAGRLPWTFLLVGSALLAGTALGLVAGVHSGWRRGRATDRVLLTVFVGIRNFPPFFLGSLLLFVFAVRLRWFPLAGASEPDVALTTPGGVIDIVRHLVLPASVLVVQFAAGIYLVMRAGMVGELGADHLLLGRAKGLSQLRLKYRYAARNALLPVVNLTALQVGFAVTGTIFVETVFAYPGIGRLMFDAVSYRDYPTLQGCFLVLTLTVVSANFAADLLHARLDPRTTR